MKVIGFSGIRNGSYYLDQYGLRFIGHDSAVALINNGKLVFAAEEERFSRSKHSSCYPTHALEHALEWAGLELQQIDQFGYTWGITPRKFVNMNLHHTRFVPLPYWPELAIAGIRVIRDLMSPQRIKAGFEKEIGRTLPDCCGVPHHMGHSACAYYTSPFDQAAVLTVDGQGEDESSTMGEWHGTTYTPITTIRSPNSIGILYGMITDFLGMRAAWDEYKVMGMSSLGNPERFREAFKKMVILKDHGKYETYRTAMVFKPNYCNEMLARVLQIPPRSPDMPLQQVHFDLAASLQECTQNVIFHLLQHLRKSTALNDLCLAGGVFLNSVINGKIRRSGLFNSVHIPPVPGDHGGPLGAATYLYHLKRKYKENLEFTVFCGPGYEANDMRRALDDYAGKLEYCQPHDLYAKVAKALLNNQIIGWFQGRMEYGPRALGHRSILGNPTNPDMKDIINSRIKHREEFRPFAGSVPEELAKDYFDIEGSSPYMQFVLPVRPEFHNLLSSIVHKGTCRVQTVSSENTAFYKLLLAFKELSGIPILLNTSFNDNDEPIVCTPEDAIKTFLRTDIDHLVLGNFWIKKTP